jgi:tRNA pseudouridine(38-40) synthase
MEDTSTQSSKRQVITFVMTTEYNGFAYAGFQRQSRTPTLTSSKDDITPTEKKRKRSHELQSANNNKSGRKSNGVLTVQDRIEQALHKWTGISLFTLRVRGAGRTDKGVHATHQVVAFDVPLTSLIDDEATNNSGDRDGDTEISAHALPLLREAYHNNLTRDETETNPFIDHWKIRRAISTRLPTDIVIRSIRIWNGSVPFEARKNVACKTYIYRLRFRCIAYETAAKLKEGRANMHPICTAGPHLLRRLNDHNTVWLSPWPLDKDKIRQACGPFVGRHNFYNFVHKAERKESNSNSRPSLVRRCERYQQSTSNADDENGEDKYLMDLFEFNVHLQPEEEPDKTLPPIIDATFTLKAKGFHRSQVRNLVGFVVDVARGERSLDDATVLLKESGDASDAKSLPTVNSAPASGLCLANVKYEHTYLVA